MYLLINLGVGKVERKGPVNYAPSNLVSLMSSLSNGHYTGSKGICPRVLGKRLSLIPAMYFIIYVFRNTIQ